MQSLEEGAGPHYSHIEPMINVFTLAALGSLCVVCVLGMERRGMGNVRDSRIKVSLHML